MTKRDKVYTYVLAVLLGLMVALVMLAASNYPAYAEDAEEIDPTIVYTEYNGEELFGLAKIPQGGKYWARVVMYEPPGAYVIVFVPIMADGTFALRMWANVTYMVASVVDSPTVYGEHMGPFEDWPVI